jgi:uncharacterized protein DUF6152
VSRGRGEIDERREVDDPSNAAIPSKTMMRSASFVCGALAALHAGVASSHHGDAEYDFTVVARYEGVVVEHQWRNPHTLTKLATHTASGQPITLEIEGGSPSILRTSGVTADSIVAGEQVTAVVSPSRRFPNESAYGLEIVKADGTVVPLDWARRQRAPAGQLTQAATDVFGTWLPPRDGFQQMLQWAFGWELTEKGQQIRARYTPMMHRHAECMPMSAPMLMKYPLAVGFTKLDDRVVIRSDWLGAERTVYMDGRDHPPANERFLQGHSTGRWEGKVLVVDTRNFGDEVWAGVQSGQSKHLVERFTLSGDGRSLGYSFVLEDPEYLAHPVSGDGTMSYRPDLKFGGVECDLDLAQRFFRERQ